MIPYDVVAIEANRILLGMILVEGYETYFWDYYQSYLEACGWSDEAFDRETLRRVDADWDPVIWN